MWCDIAWEFLVPIVKYWTVEHGREYPIYIIIGVWNITMPQAAGRRLSQKWAWRQDDCRANYAIGCVFSCGSLWLGRVYLSAGQLSQQVVVACWRSFFEINIVYAVLGPASKMTSNHTASIPQDLSFCSHPTTRAVPLGAKRTESPSAAI